VKRWLLGIIIVFLIVIWQTSSLAFHLLQEKSNWEALGAKWAKEKTAMTEVDKVLLYNGEDSYLAVEGKINANVPVIAWYKDGKTQGLEYRKDILSEEIISKKVLQMSPGANIIRIVPGLEKQKTLWEAVFLDTAGKYNYYYFGMRSGNFIRSYQLQNEQGT
jgi:uncharacterized protein YpmB